LNITLQPLGQHVICEMAVDARTDQLEDLPWLRDTCRHALIACGANIARDEHGQEQILFHKFHPHGTTGVIIIEESHFHISVWTEEKYVALDIFTCGETAKPTLAFAHIAHALQAHTVLQKVIRRGLPISNGGPKRLAENNDRSEGKTG